MCDLVTTTRCPACHGVTEEFIYHAHSIFDLPTVRAECLVCNFMAEHVVEGAETETR